MRSIIYYRRVVKVCIQCPHKPPSNYENLQSDSGFQTLITLEFYRVLLLILTGFVFSLNTEAFSPKAYTSEWVFL